MWPHYNTALANVAIYNKIYIIAGKISKFAYTADCSISHAAQQQPIH